MLSRGAHPSRLRLKRRRERFVRMSVWAIVALVLLLMLIGASYLPQLRVREVTIVGASTVPEEALRASIETILSQKYGYVLPKRNMVFYPRRGIEEMITATYPKIRMADVKGFSRVQVTVEERSPFALWCGESLSQECYFMDKAGYIYAPAPEFSGSVFVRYAGQGEGVGSLFLTDESFPSIASLVAELGAKVGDPTDVSIEEGDADVRFIGGFTIRFALKDAPESVIERLSLALTAEPLKGRDLSEVAYIDLRFGDRVVYKFK